MTGSSERLARRLLYRWDLDKTYLRTEFDTLKAMVRTAFESPRRKRTVAGAAVLLRELKATDPAGIHILSGSPEEMRPILERKLVLDGVRWDVLTLKPSLRNIVRGRFRFVKEQVGYKIGALLASRALLATECDEILFGDDAEADAFIYSLYADLCAGRVSMPVLANVLEAAGVHEDDAYTILSSAEELSHRESTRRILIHLDRVSLPSAFEAFGRRVCPFHNYFQAALILLEEKAIGPDAVLRVGVDLAGDHGASPEMLGASFVEVVGRQCLGPRAGELLLGQLRSEDWREAVSREPALTGLVETIDRSLSSLVDPPPPTIPTADYPALFSTDRARAQHARRGARARARRRR